MKKRFLIVFGVVTLIFVSCYKDNFRKRHPSIASASNQCDTSGVISYSTQIVPIINNYCINCHNSPSTPPDLSTYTGVQACSQGKQAKLYGSVSWDGTAQQMPQGSSTQISTCDIRKIKLWIDQGSQNN
ncbi:MAG: hypothetical protein ACXVNM_02095 [Bacteroidia bacterium]